jgi:hypothetical protein
MEIQDVENESDISRATKTERSSFYDLPQNIKCLCIDYFENWRWVALVIEELCTEDYKRQTNRLDWPSEYKSYHRVGLLEYYGAQFDWFKDCSSELIELF